MSDKDSPDAKPQWMSEAQSSASAAAGRTICTIDTYHSGVSLWHYTRALELVERPAMLRRSWKATPLHDASVFKFDVLESATIDEDDETMDVCFGRRGDMLIYMTSFRRDKTISLNIAAPNMNFAAARALMKEYQQAIPVLVEHDPDKVLLNFWYQQADTARMFPRSIVVPDWASIAGNYGAVAHSGLKDMMSWVKPNLSAGKLFLWHGPPGVGKTFAIRALAREWRSWCQFHFITDPEQMLNRAQYCLSVMEQGADEDNVDEAITHHVLVMEDTGELLTKDAKERTGQGLSRLLNIVDGILGQGHNVMVLITTNEDLGTMHEAVTRPGRCGLNLTFEPLTEPEAKTWMIAHGGPPEVVSGSMTVAELYAMAAGRFTPARRKVGFGA